MTFKLNHKRPVTEGLLSILRTLWCCACHQTLSQQRKHALIEVGQVPQPSACVTEWRVVRLYCWPSTCLSAPSTRSGLSSGSLSHSRSAEAVAVRQPSKSRIRRHTNRLSGVFLRGPSQASLGSMALTTGIKSPLSIQARKGSGRWQQLQFSVCVGGVSGFSRRCPALHDAPRDTCGSLTGWWSDNEG